MLLKKSYEIESSVFDAYFDDAGNLIFVLDNTLDTRKPNVLLVMDPVQNRKWDDILSNDFDVDLKTIRPKKDNKFQKLDIEYSGLVVYSKLIADFEEGNDMETALAGLSAFRDLSVRRSAADRITASAEIVLKTKDTVTKTEQTIAQVSEKITELKEKRTTLKKQIGREPTKQSAAKILKVESQIDTAVAKLKRSNKRLKNAQRRIQIAEDDIKAAQTILKSKEYFEMLHDNIPNQNPNQFESDDDMAQNEVKPIIEKDPEIMDDSIAFKPVAFDDENKNEEIVDAEETLPAPEPVSEPIYSEPVQEEPATQVEPEVQDDEEDSEPVFAPMEFKPISFDDDDFDKPKSTNYFTDDSEPEASQENSEESEETQSPFDYNPEPVAKPEPIADEPVAPVAPVAPVIPAPEVSRPASPLTGSNAPATFESSASEHHHRGPSALYYVALFILIGLSVFTLWLYQNKTGTNMPSIKEANETVLYVETIETDTPIQVMDVNKNIESTNKIQIVQPANQAGGTVTTIEQVRIVDAPKPVKIVETTVEPVQPVQVVETVTTVTETIKPVVQPTQVVETVTITETIEPVVETVQIVEPVQPVQVIETVTVTETIEPMPVPEPVQVIETVEVMEIVDPVQMAAETGRPVQVVVPVHPGEFMGLGTVDMKQEKQKIQESIQAGYQTPTLPMEDSYTQEEVITTTVETEEFYYEEPRQQVRFEEPRQQVRFEEPMQQVTSQVYYDDAPKIDTADAVRQMQAGNMPVAPKPEYNVSGATTEMVGGMDGGVVTTTTTEEIITTEETYYY